MNEKPPSQDSEIQPSFNHETGSLRLEKLVIEGFKSFAGRVQIQFQPGVTAIVGPNGCGKSNIVDAIRWVLGEPSAKSLRAEAMQDVLFAGAQGSPAASLAQVSLELSGRHPSRPLFIDRFEIERRLFRTGESEYKLNKRPCRLKDIHELFADTGLGRNAFAIFEQGRLEQMVIMSPLQRRLLIEEAAGIAGFKIQKKEALAKWQLIDTQLEQVSQVYQELDARLSLLKDQAQKALDWKACQNEIERLVRLGQIHKWNELDALSKELSDRLKRSEQQLEVMRHEKQQAQEKIAFQEGQLEKEEASFLELFQESQKAREKEIETSQALKFLQTQHEDESRLKTGFKDQIEKLELKQQNLTSQFEHGKEQLKHLQQSYDKIEDSLKVCEENLEKARHEQNESFKQKQQLEARQLEKKHQKQLLEQKLQGLRNQKQQLSRQCQGTIQSIERLTQELLQHQNEYKNLEAKVSQLRSEQIQESLLEQLRQEQTAEQESLEASRKNLLELEAQVHQRNAHLKWLEERLRSSSGKALGQWMGTCTDLEKQTKLIPLNEILAKEIPKDELGFWKHLESVYLVDQAYIEVIEKGLEPDQAPSFALWPIERQAQETFEQACRRQIKYALTLHLEKNKGKVWKTWAGRLVRVDEMGILWSMEKSASSAQMLQELPREKALLQEQKIQQQELVQLVASSQQQVEAIKKSLASLEKQSVAQALNLQKEQSRLESLGHRLEFLKEQKNAQEQARETLVKSLEPIEISLQEGEKELLVVGGYKEEALMPIQHLIQESQSHFHRLKSQKETLEHEKNHILTQKARFQAQIQSAEGLLKEGQESLRENQASYEAYVLKEKTTLVRLEQGREQQAQFVSQSQKLSFELEEKQKRSVALKQQIKELLRQIKAVEAKSEQCQQKAFHEGKKLDEVQWGKRALEESIDLQEAQLWDGVDVNPKDLEHQIAGHKARQQELGFVNFAAAKELGDMQERHSLIQTQMEDVQAAKVELMRVIAYLDEKCHLQFSETYERVKEAFKRNFIQIFEGGTADLIQKGDEENQGVDIQAFPPGKQVKSLVLMSGGEKCLTALAFMMALFEVRPAPFCLLDEIDAPLDDSNVEKLIRLLKHYSDRTQIFIITHNKKTMAAASTLLGVSMPKRGVSQLLVLDIETRQVQIGALTLASL